MVSRQLVKVGLSTLIISSSATGLVAQTLITPDAFLDIADGKTLTFTDFASGALAGVEEYLRRDLSVWREPNGRCVYGDITVEGNQVCFLYLDAPNDKQCWWPFLAGDRLLVKFAELDGQVQEVTAITTDGLACPEIPSS